MSDLTTEEKVFLIECYFSRGKVYREVFRGFRSKFGTHRVANENTLKRMIDNFVQHGTLQDQRHDNSSPSYSVITEDTLEDVEQYFAENPNASVRKAAQTLNISKTTLHRILKHFLKMHLFKITTHQLLTQDAMVKRVEFCKNMTQMFENEELNENAIIFSDEAHFWLNGYVNKQNYRFWGKENPNVTSAKPLHPEKITVWVAISVKGSFLQVLDSTVTTESYKELLETKLFPHAKKRSLVKNFHFMQDGTAPHRTTEVLKAVHKVYMEIV